MTTQSRNPFHHEDCPTCGARLFVGSRYDGQKIRLDLDTKIYALIGGRNPTEIVSTEMAMALHSDVCVYRDVK